MHKVVQNKLWVQIYDDDDYLYKLFIKVILEKLCWEIFIIISLLNFVGTIVMSCELVKLFCKIIRISYIQKFCSKLLYRKFDCKDIFLKSWYENYTQKLYVQLYNFLKMENCGKQNFPKKESSAMSQIDQWEASERGLAN